METRCENIPVETWLGNVQGQTAVEGEITLPGGLREEARVLYAEAMAVVESIEAQQDQVTVSGRVIFRALYTQGDPDKPQAMEAGADFTHSLPFPGAQPKALCRGGAAVEHVEASACSGRLSLRAVLGLRCRLLCAQSVAALTGIAQAEGLEQRTERFPLRRTVAQGERELLVREAFPLPAGLKETQALYGSARAQLAEITGGLGRAGLSGAVELEVYHADAAPGRPLSVTRHTLPFAQTVELTGEDGESLAGRAVVKDVAVVTQETPEGEKTLRAEVLLGLYAWAEREETAVVLQDAYTTQGEDLRLTMLPLRLRGPARYAQAAESGKAMLHLPEGSPAARTVLCAFAQPVLSGREQIGGRLNLEGMLEVTVLYMTDGSAAPVAVFLEEPFHATFALESGEEDFLTLLCGEVEASAITSDRVEMKYILHLTAEGMDVQQAQWVAAAEPLPDAPAPSDRMILYFAQPGETAWDIARRYRLPRAQLDALNPSLAQQNPAPGDALLVWRRQG